MNMNMIMMGRKKRSLEEARLKSCAARALCQAYQRVLDEQGSSLDKAAFRIVVLGTGFGLADLYPNAVTTEDVLRTFNSKECSHLKCDNRNNKNAL